MSNTIPFELYQKMKDEEPQTPSPFTSNKRLREMDLEMGENPIEFLEIQSDKENSKPETNRPPANSEIPVEFWKMASLPSPVFIYNPDLNPFVKRTNPPVPPKKVSFVSNNHIPVLNEDGIRRRDLRFSKLRLVKLNGVDVPVKNFIQLRNKMLGMFYRKVLRPENDITYCKDGLSVRGVGTRQNVLAIVRLAKILHFQLNILMTLRDGQMVRLVVA